MPIEIDIRDDNAAEIESWRVTKKNNKSWLRHKLLFECLADTGERFLPRLLTELGFFESTSRIKKNHANLWVTLDDHVICHQVELKWCKINLWLEDI